MFFSGILIGLVLGLIIGLKHKLFLKVISFLIVAGICLLPFVGIGYALYFYTSDAIVVMSLIFIIISIAYLTNLLSKKTFLNKDGSGCIVIGLAANILFIYTSVSDYINNSSLECFARSSLFIIYILVFQIFVYKKGLKRRANAFTP